MQFQTKASKPRRVLPVLPRYYYHRNFCDLLDFVERRYTHVFEDEHSAFIEEFQSLPRDAQCLYARLAGRKGKVFDTAKLPYSEIRDIPAQLETLQVAGFVSDVKASHYTEFLTALTKPDLTDLMG